MLLNGSKLVFKGKFMDLVALANGVAVVSFDQKNSRVNLLSSSMMGELASVLSLLEVPGAYKGAIFISLKPDCFIAGADIKEIQKAQAMPVTAAYNGCQDGKALFARISALPFNTVAVLNGRCLGGGTELALACKIRLASKRKETVIGLPEVGLGVIPGWGGTVKAPKLIGFAAALPLILNPLAPFSAEKAWRSGLVCELVEREMKVLFARANELALGAAPKRFQKSALAKAATAFGNNVIARKVLSFAAVTAVKLKIGSKYPAPARAVAVMNAAFAKSESEAFDLESRTFAELCHTPACAECVEKFLAYQKAKKEKALSRRRSR